ncbi:MAG: prolyl oligopeptidase family serine peptidase [Candidatus Eisenbacteria bacterium]|uniref:Prolyl oligopeptidase family serine peptidase n=1 Tax=Eiseniibacteriota bacterium TaxID=2212470 RepID=A0A849SJB4_UNCEI|nr:prolyl oligopeptidase family serine peptidase [Candidatus Eisenbacteria bacterium]
MRHTWLASLFALVILGSSLATVHAANDAPRLVVPDAPQRATIDFRWRFSVKIVNPLEFGLFVDSLVCDVHVLDPGTTRTPRVRRMPLNIAMRQQATVSGGDSISFAYNGNAVCDSARLVLRMSSHLSSGKRLTTERILMMHPGPTSRQNPSRLVRVAGQSIEFVQIDGSGGGSGLGHGIVIVSGDDSHARRLLPTGANLVAMGYSVILVSPPGFGMSSGEPDWGGPVTQAAIRAALDTLRATRHVSPRRIALWGIGSGATAAARVAATDTALAAVVLTEGYFDYESIYTETKSAELRKAIDARIGASSPARRLASAINDAVGIRAPVLIVHSPIDSVVPMSQAQTYEAALRSTKSDVKFAEQLGAGRGGVIEDSSSFAIVFIHEKIVARR